MGDSRTVRVVLDTKENRDALFRWGIIHRNKWQVFNIERLWK